MYKLTTDLAKNRILVTFVGAFDYDARDLAKEIQDASQRIRLNCGHFDMLSDWTQASTMPQEHAKAGEDVVAWCVANGLRKSANVMDAILLQMQVKRVSNEDDKIGFFATQTEAEAWLSA
ncbi:MAG: hypothetical protein ABJP48_05700 [Erythrobacter sp.]